MKQSAWFYLLFMLVLMVGCTTADPAASIDSRSDADIASESVTDNAAVSHKIDAEQKPPNSIKNPNEVICEKTARAGSRLRPFKICMTRKNWDVQRQNSKDTMSGRGG